MRPRRLLMSLIVFLPAAIGWGSFVPMLPGHVSRVGSIGDLTLTAVYPRIFTPNGDGWNDKVVFHFDNPEALPLSGKVYDLPGAQVATLNGGSDPSTTLTWDGKDTDGRTVPGGIYLYEVDFQGKAITGTVVVAR